MSWTPARLALGASGAAFLFAALLGTGDTHVPGLAALGITLGGPLLAWHWVLGLLAVGFALFPQRDALARAATFTLAFVSAAFGVAARVVGLTPVDAAFGAVVALVLLVAAALPPKTQAATTDRQAN